MHKIDTASAVDGAFVDKNSALNVEGTQVDAAWLNAVQDEICNTILAAGLTLNKNNNGQLASAVSLIANSLTHRDAMHFTGSDAEQQSTNVYYIGSAFDVEVGDIIDLTVDLRIVDTGLGNVEVYVGLVNSGTNLVQLKSVNAGSEGYSATRTVYQVPAGAVTGTASAIIKLVYTNETHPTISVRVAGYHSKN